MILWRGTTCWNQHSRMTNRLVWNYSSLPPADRSIFLILRRSLNTSMIMRSGTQWRPWVIWLLHRRPLAHGALEPRGQHRKAKAPCLKGRRYSRIEDLKAGTAACRFRGIREREKVIHHSHDAIFDRSGIIQLILIEEANIDIWWFSEVSYRLLIVKKRGIRLSMRPNS